MYVALRSMQRRPVLRGCNWRRRVLWTFVLSPIAGACDPASEPAAIQRAQITSWDTIITGQSGTLGRVESIRVGNDGDVWVADNLNARVYRVTSDGVIRDTIGGPGDGPGEFQRPQAIALSDSLLVVFDFNGRRVTRLTHDGTEVGRTRIAFQPYLPLDIGADGEIAMPVLGQQGALVRLVDVDGGEAVLLGDAPAAMPATISRSRLREQVLRGEMPQEFLNNVVPVLAGNNGVWSVGQADGSLKHFEADGSERLSLTLPEPTVVAARARFFAGWEETDGIVVPWMVRAGQQVGDRLWLLTDGADPDNGDAGALLVLDATSGSVEREIRLPHRAGAFAIDPAANVVYLYLPDSAELVRAVLPTI